MLDDLEKREANGGVVEGSLERGYQLTLPKLGTERYCLAQVDNYMHLPRGKFPHQQPLKLQLEARVSSGDLSGTWGFGLWNDPFSLGFGAGGMMRFLPVLPNAAWFFYGSKENFLSLRDNQPRAGFHAKTFRSPLLPSILSLSAVPFVPLMLWPAAARQLRKLSRVMVKEDFNLLAINVEEWHAYSLVWKEGLVLFEVDGLEVFRTGVSPRGRLGLVIWIDNQFFRFDPGGKLGFGFLKTASQFRMQLRNLTMAYEGGYD